MGWDCTKDRVVAFDKRPEPLNNPVLGCEQHLLVKDLQLWSSLPGNNHLQRQDVSDLHADNEYRIDCAQHEKLPGVCLGQRCHLDSVFFTCAIVAMSTHGCKVHVTGNHRERTVSFVLNWKILIQTCGLSNNRLSSVGPAIRVLLWGDGRKCRTQLLKRKNFKMKWDNTIKTSRALHPCSFKTWVLTTMEPHLVCKMNFNWHLKCVSTSKGEAVCNLLCTKHCACCAVELKGLSSTSCHSLNRGLKRL